MDLETLCSEDNLQLKKVTHRECSGACPKCGGTDRFRVFTRNNRYWCRQCGIKGDAVQYLRDIRGLSFREAAELAGKEIVIGRPLVHKPVKEAYRPREIIQVGHTWQAQAQAFLKKSVSLLCSAKTEQYNVINWLQGRGITQDTSIKAGLGWNEKDLYLDRQIWDLPQELKEDGKPRKLWIPAGLVIPLVIDGQVIRLRIRRPEGEPRYVIVSGSDTRAMILGNNSAVLIVESELDAILINQLAGDIVRVIALGSAQIRPDVETDSKINNAPVVLMSLDSDKAGVKEAWQWWPETYGGKLKRWPCIYGKDPTEAMQAGLNLRQWILAGLLETEEKEERFAIMKFDGGLSESESIEQILKNTKIQEVS